MVGHLLLGLRMLVHPLLNAGVYYSLQHRDMNAGYRFVEGIRKLSLPFFGLYFIQLALLLSPLYWLVPYTIELYGHQTSYISFGKALAPALAATSPIGLCSSSSFCSFRSEKPTAGRPFTPCCL